jgi:hypothetical protein
MDNLRYLEGRLVQEAQPLIQRNPITCGDTSITSTSHVTNLTSFHSTRQTPSPPSLDLLRMAALNMCLCVLPMLSVILWLSWSASRR